MVVGGVSSTAYKWIQEFSDLVKSNKLQVPYAYAMHAYPQGKITVSKAESELLKGHQKTNSKIWLSEYAMQNGNLSNFESLTKWVKKQPWIERYAAFTNRSGTESWAIGSGCNLVNNDGNLTPIGKYYSSL